jgi:alpha-galactosidase
MDPLEYVAVRFHFNGSYVQTGASLQYVEGIQEMVQVERDKMSHPEIRGHFKEVLEARIEDVQKAESCHYYWLLPVRDFSNGLMLLQDDRSCNQMEKSTVGCSVADIFVDDVSEHLQTSEQQGEGEDINEMNAYYTNPNSKKRSSTTKKKGKEKLQEDSDEDESLDSDYMPGDDSSSEDDDRANFGCIIVSHETQLVLLFPSLLPHQNLRIKEFICGHTDPVAI